MIFRFFNFRSIVTYLTIVSFYLATTNVAVAASSLPPISLARMYSLASQGNVRALRAAVQRGLNIDATDRYGNTGLCHAILQRNYIAYNAFHASGANPRHPCIQNIPVNQYDYFMASSRATPITATPRDAYKEFADGEFVLSTTGWIIGGVVLAGGITALVLSGSGGSKKKSPYYFSPNNTNNFTPTDDSLAAFVGTQTPSQPATQPYQQVVISNGKNTSDFTVDNDSQILVNGITQNLSDVINFHDSVLDYSKYLQVAMKAVDANQVVNGQMPLTGTEVGTTITLKNNTIGMAALHDAVALNNNTLKIIAGNGTMGQVGSDRSLIRNNGIIDISFQGTKQSDQVNGMYVDTSSTAINDGKITGNVAVDSSAGTLIGMQGRLINQVSNPSGSLPVQMTNNGDIDLSATATAGKTISNALIGMGSFLENAFLEGAKLLRRTGFIEMANDGNITLNVNLGDTGVYDASQNNLYDGTGGIIGMRADAHTTAVNNNNIQLAIAPENATGIENSHAGMLSVHGGIIVNNKNITIDGGIGGYGMLGVRGEGANSEFNTLNPTLVNAEGGTINVNSINGFGMASRHGGNVTNNGSIVMGDVGTGLQINAGNGVNAGSIVLNNGGNGMAIKKNATSESGSVYNASAATLQNQNVITINNANDSSGMSIEDGTADNLAGSTININSVNTNTLASYGIQAQNGTAINSGDINVDVLLSGDTDSYGMYGANSATVNNAGNISFAKKGTGTYTVNGSNTNSGTITMNGMGSTGMASTSGAIVNTITGKINLVSGTGITSDTGQVTNNGSITISNGTSSTGISSGSHIENNGSVLITGADSTGLSVEENGTMVNNGIITLTSNKNSKENYGMISAGGDRSQIENNGTITLNGYNYAASQENGFGMSIGDGSAINNGTITINDMYGFGMASTSGTLTNNKDIFLNMGGVGIKGESGETFNATNAQIIVKGTPTLEKAYGMAMESGTARNFGTIDVTGSITGDASYGIYVNGGNGINDGLLEMRSNNAYGLFDAGSGTITNSKASVINLYGNNVVGMEIYGGADEDDEATSTNAKAENLGTINIGVRKNGVTTGGNNGTGMIARTGTTAINSGNINLNGTDTVGMFADGGTVINTVDGVITLNGNNGTIFKADNGGKAINQGNLEINVNNYELFSATDEKSGTFINDGHVTVNSSGSRIIVAGDNTNVTNNNAIELNGDDDVAIYTTANANIINNGNITISEDSDNSHGIYVTDTTTGTTVSSQDEEISSIQDTTVAMTMSYSDNYPVNTLQDDNNQAPTLYAANTSSKAIVNTAEGQITVNGNNSSGITLVSSDSSLSIINQGKIQVNGDGSKAITATNGGTIDNEGSIVLSGNSIGIDATGGTINNKIGASITIDTQGSGYGIKTTNGTVSNQGEITIQGANGVGIKQNNGIVNNFSKITVSGTNNVGILQDSGTIENYGEFAVTGINATGISTGGTITNEMTVTASGNGAKGMEVTTGGTAINNSAVIVSGDNASGIYVNGGTATNNSTITSSGNNASGIYAANGTATNLETINVSGDGSIGMTASNGSVVNGKVIQVLQVDEEGNPVVDDDGNEVYEDQTTPAQIAVSGTNAAGMKLAGSGNVINLKGASISVEGNGSTGIWAEGSGNASNEGSITVTANNASGMKATQGTATNKEQISVEAKAWGLHANGGSVINDTNGIIDLNEEGAVGIYVSSGNGNNLGQILLNKQGTIGLQADGGTATNSAELNINTTDAIGLYANGGTIVNAAEITLSSGQAAILVDKGKGSNNATITVSGGNGAILVNGGSATNESGATIALNTSGFGMKATNGIVDNQGTIEVASGNAVGMAAEGNGTATNNKNINVLSSGSTGMDAAQGATVTNTGTITASEASSIGMSASGGNAVNNGVIYAQSANSYAMSATDGTVTNNGTINATVANSTAMYANGGTAVNGENGKINTSAAYAMFAQQNGTVINQGTLTFTGSGAALQANGAKAINNGTITTSGTTGSALAAYGTSTTGASATNNGTLTVNATSGAGMLAISFSTDTTITNAASGVINVNGASAVGMLVDGTNAKAVNLGTINITTTSANAIGMKASNGGAVENAGTIKFASGANGTGIYIDKDSKLYNNASGTIIFEGGNTLTGAISGNPETGIINLCEDGTNSCANRRFVYMEESSQLINSGTMVSTASLNTDEMGQGQIMLTSTGSLSAADEIKGSLYALSDNAMVAQGQKDVYYNTNALSAEKIDVSIHSSSPMWEVALVDSASNEASNSDAQEDVSSSEENDTVKENNTTTESKDIVYRRVAFQNLVEDAEQAEYLEQNYAIRNAIYDPLMTADSIESFNKALISELGSDLLPNFTKQNMDVLRNVNRQVNNAVFNNTDTQEFRSSVGYDYFDRQQDGNNGLTGYEDEAHSAYAIFDKKYNANFRYGIGAAVTKYKSDYDNSAERNEIIAQIMTPLLFNTDNTSILSMPRLGLGWGEYKRISQGMEYKADTRNYYYGISNEARHDIDMDVITLEPTAEFNVLGLYQNRTKENIRVEGSNNVSVEGGLGLYVKKSFTPIDEDELNIRLGGTYYHEFASPYQSVKAGIVGLLGNYHLSGYELQRDRAVLSARFDYKRGKFNVYLEGSRFIEDDSTYSINAGLSYAF